MSVILKLEDVNGYYKTIQVLYHINMAVEEKSITTILGANGSGKTTIFRAICGIIDVEGLITFTGKRIDNMATEKIARLGVSHVPEGRGTFLELTVEENFRLATILRKDCDNIEADLARFYNFFPSLLPLKHQAAGNLSGGEQQMVAMGRAFLLKPKLLLLDEPSIGLAPQVVKSIFDIMKQINQEEGVTILLNEQNVNLALEVSHHVYLLETGMVVYSGPPSALKADDSICKAYLGY